MKPLWAKYPLTSATALLSLGILLKTTGRTEKFYEHRFVVNVDPDDLAGFYGGENFMELFCVLPFVGTLMMRGGEFDDEGTVHTTGFPGEMLVSMVFSEDENDNGQTDWFNKRERFKDLFMGYKAWDMVSNFGFRTLPSGRLEVYHSGEYFDSNIPIFGGIVYYVFKVHSYWLAFATAYHLKYHAFRADTDEEEELEERSRADLPLHLVADVLPYEIKKFFFSFVGIDAGTPPYKAESTVDYSIVEDEEEDQEEDRAAHLQRLMTRVEQDIKYDREYQRRSTIRRMATLRNEPDADVPKPHEELDLETEILGKNKGGNVVWESLKRTNNPEGYLKATRMALKRRETRVGKPLGNQLGRKDTRVDVPRTAGRR